MNSSWIEILIDPASVTSARGADQRRSAIALLLDGRLDEYERRSADAHLPSLSEAGVTTPPDAEAQLVVAVARLAEGQPNAIDLFTSLAASTDVPTDLRSVAAVLAGMAMSDAARPDLALPLLDERLSEATDDFEIAFLEMHWAARAAECGRFGEAHARSVSAQTTAQRAEESAETIRIVAAHNAAQFAWLAGEPRFPADLPRRADSKPIAWMDILAAGALEDYLDGHFKAFFERPYARSVTFAREDQTERGLSRALFRAQCLADWHGEARLRKALGRYRLLSEAGRTIPGAASGFELLRRARDAEGLERAIGVFRAAGPLEPLRDSGARAAAMPWWPLELRANLAILAQTADAIDPESAGSALDRILDGLTELLQFVPGSGWVVDPVTKALAALTPLVDVRRQRRVARAIRQLANRPPDPLLHQSIGRVLHSLDWQLLGKAEVGHWVTYVAANLGARDDHVFPAMDAAHELISLRPRSIARAAQAAFRETGSLYVASVLLRQESIRAADRRMIEGKVLDLAHSIQRDASEGKYSMGLVRTGALLGRLAISASRARLFDEALSFAFNARVPLEERIAVVESFLAEPEKVPKRFKHRLARGLPAAQIGIPLFGTPTDLEGINLRLAAIFGDMSPDRVLGPLLRLAHSASQDARLQAVHAMPAVERLLDSGTFLAILVGLTHDPDPFVRASGGNSLASAQLPDAVQPVRTARLVELLEEPGGLVPRAVWLGLAQSRRSGESPSPELEARAERVAAGHIAYSVRRAATDFIASRHADALQ